MARLTPIKATLIASGSAMLATVATIALTTTSPFPAHADIPPPVIAQAPLGNGGVPTLAPLVKSLLPAVVNIQVSSKVEMQNPLLNDPFFRRFFNVPNQPQTREMQAIGSGVIIDAEKGYILTNNHVVEKADKVKVRLSDDREFDAKVVGSDPETDVAVLKVKPDKLTAMKVGDSDALQVGDFVLAIGSPFNLRSTVTSGIVSQLGRSNTGEGGGIQDFIQTDASINPGNSGGALVNLKGELVGINSQILSGGGGSIGIGFAIPVNLAKSVADQLISGGKIERGRIGIAGQQLTPEIAKELGLKDSRGALVAQVVAGSPADKAGIKIYDVITEANGKKVENFEQLHTIIGLLKIGEPVSLKLIRDGQPKDVTVVVAKSSDVAGADADNLNPLLEGATFGAVSAEEEGTNGIQVLNIKPGTAAADTELQPGDIIVAVNRHAIRSLEDLHKFAGAKSGNLLLQVRRGNGMFIYPLQAPAP